MLLEWLEPVVNKRCEDINDELLRQMIDNPYNEFMNFINKNESLSEIEKFHLENFFILQCKKSVEVSYRCGIKEGLALFRVP
ncbi:hypothetical protein P4H66_19290 [Paenibacillus dokdonensis]|uniref:Uncharacterized protein n=1 Tax=Paenibacillus dokdonensis TaxID=2567944 RepID=A0ABU6GQG0_9BACL|nr:hypothetical protein [Paenibacillus dokdonensis]MEC0241950.1 hypothetical protein [Paenibacillus dokdonensis]